MSTDELNDLSHLREYWSQNDLNQDEKFLRDYILHNQHVDKCLDSKNSSNVPTYSQIVGIEDINSESDFDEQDLEHEYKNEDFERGYNFRYNLLFSLYIVINSAIYVIYC